MRLKDTRESKLYVENQRNILKGVLFPPTGMTPKATRVEEDSIQLKENNLEPQYKLEIKWHNVFLLGLLHFLHIYSIYRYALVGSPITWIFVLLWGIASGVGVTGGSHRLWTHRSYKAKLPLRILLCVLHSISAEKSIYDWCRDHRVHHKFTETNADPHNIKRGFFFAHVGWMMCKKHPDVVTKGKTISMQDLLDDPVVRFHRRFYIPLSVLFSIYLPTMIPVWCWSESFVVSLFYNFSRLATTLNFTWLVNSAAHMFGNRPFDKSIEASENPVVSLLTGGEGWHNYHHAFPWDYSTSELGNKFNMTKIFIDFMAKIGQAYDLKQADPELVYNRKMKTGDGTRLECTTKNL